MKKNIKGFGKTTTTKAEPAKKSAKMIDDKKPIKKDGDKLSNENIKASLGDAPYVVFALDSTGSMSSCIDECRNNLRDLIKQLFLDNPRTRVGFVLFGDYIDGQRCISIKDFSDNADEIVQFIIDTPNTGGGDEPECYELVLNRVADMKWTEEGGALVLVGDTFPHPEQDSLPMNNPEHLNWRTEVRRLLAKKVKVFPCQCLYHDSQWRAEHNAFWKELSTTCQTPLLKMDFKDSAYTLGAISYVAAAGTEGLRGFMSKDTVCCKSTSSMGFASNLSDLAIYTAKLDKDEKV